ncbi:MAG: major facilitator superfamily domain-containing protein 7 [Candidatus Heimdallarchaeota archaeon]|nr:major facilitator superfamily domain-containing protein 7 [Candidatus Heimdallarchaeota archaeon]
MVDNQGTTYEVYRYRWTILLLFMFVALMTQVNWITFAPIMNELAEDYDVSTDAILLLTVSYMIVYIIMNFPATWAIDKYGLKWGTGFGVILTGVFGMGRAFAGSNYSLLLFMQVMTAIGQPFLLNSFTKVAVNWFPEEEKTTATGLGTVAILVGVIIGMIVTPILYESRGIDFVLYVYGILSLVSMVLYLIFVKNTPDTPPSQFAGSKVFDFKGVVGLFKNRDFNILLFLVFVGLGAFNAVSSEVDLIFERFSDDTEAAGLIGGMMVIGGIIGAGILSTISDKIHKRKIFLLIAMLTSIPLSYLLTEIDNFNTVLIISFIFGFFLVSALPIGLILAAELTHPVTEEASNGMMMTIGQISGILLVIQFSMTVITALFAVGFVFSLFLNDVNSNDKNENLFTDSAS